ncbi:MAG: xanthine dehydrogenase family protein subunit M [Betaproteobacteria bacterium]|nr:MAG: xanthine dehydrogenase family protein subunit M [Betaproteobacteria bacterium]
MKAPAFRYARPESLDEAIALLVEHGTDARVLAGGQSLMPMLNLRLLQPSVLVDINRLPLSEIRLQDQTLDIGALARHAEVLYSGEVAHMAPLLKLALPHVAHLAVRNRGTHGGSCALADPSAEIPACALALEASFVLRGPRGERRVPAELFFRGLYETALGADELLVRVDYPRAQPGWRYGFQEVARRHGDFAIAGLAAAARVEGGVLREARLAFFGVADRPVLVRGASVEELRERTDKMEVSGTRVYPPPFRRRLVRVLLERVTSSIEK